MFGFSDADIRGAASAASSAASPAGGAGAAPAAAAEPPKKVQTEFTVKISKFDDKSKIMIIKEVRAITGLGLKQVRPLDFAYWVHCFFKVVSCHRPRIW